MCVSVSVCLRMCVCVCVSDRQRECVCVCVCVFEFDSCTAVTKPFASNSAPNGHSIHIMPSNGYSAGRCHIVCSWVSLNLELVDVCVCVWVCVWGGWGGWVGGGGGCVVWCGA